MENKNLFIESYYLEDINICDKLILLHTQNNEKSAGQTHTNGKLTAYSPSIKNSIDSCFVDYFKHPILVDYVQQLNVVLNNYIKKYKFCNWYNPWSIIEPINIQQYNPGCGYNVWHTERNSNNYVNSTRHLVFMTYLNDISDQGETEFFYQELKIKPRKGLTVFWPADWTHTHRGIPSMSQEKYIITGWFNYIEKKYE